MIKKVNAQAESSARDPAAIQMKSIIFIITFLLQCFWVLGQNSHAIDKYNFDKDCDQGGQQNINVCYTKAEEKLSKIMEIKYECVTAYFDIQIKKYSSSIADTSIVANYIKEKQFLISSQTAWRKLADENARFLEIGGGTITPMYVAKSLIKDIKDRLKWLDGVIEEEGQGNEIKVLKCK